MSDDLHFEDIHWKVRMERLTERLAKHCIGCPYTGARCGACDCGTAASIIRDRDTEAVNQPARDAKLKPESRRIKVAGSMKDRGWLKPADILWPCETPANVRTMDLEYLMTAGIVERVQPDPANARVFLYRRAEK